MAKIKKIYDDAARTNQVYPQTHEKAVVDNNGTTAETKFQMITDLVQQAQMEVGAVPSDLTPTPNSTNWVTSGGIYASLTSKIEDTYTNELASYDASDFTDKKYYNSSGNLANYSDAGKYGALSIDLTQFSVGDKVVAKWESASSAFSFIKKKDNTLITWNGNNTEKTLIIDASYSALLLSNRTQQCASPYINIYKLEKGLDTRVSELEEVSEDLVVDVGALNTGLNGKIEPVANMDVEWISGSYWKGTSGTTASASNYMRCEVDISELNKSVIDIYAYKSGGEIYRVKKNGTTTKEGIVDKDSTYHSHWQMTVSNDDDKLRVSNRTDNVSSPYLTIIHYISGAKDDIDSLEDRVEILETGSLDKSVDLIMFMGQSNMAGRGITNSTWPQDAPTVPSGTGYEFRAISDPTRLYGVTKTFGITENVTGAINDGTMKTGGLVPSFINSYYKVCGVPIVGVSASEGGTSTTNWAPNSDRLNDAINRLSTAVTWLTKNGYTIRHKYMAWCQGETDGDGSVSKANHKTRFLNIFNAMKAEGIEKCFMIRIGEDNASGGNDYTNIILAQNELCQENEDIVMVSTSFASMKARGLMKDSWHYYQEGYNQVGAQAGYWSAVYREYHREGIMYDVKTDDLYYTRWSY